MSAMSCFGSWYLSTKEIFRNLRSFFLTAKGFANVTGACDKGSVECRVQIQNHLHTLLIIGIMMDN